MILCVVGDINAHALSMLECSVSVKSIRCRSGRGLQA